jgi:hypothetical protein
MKYFAATTAVLVAAFLYAGCTNTNVNPVAPVIAGSWDRLDSANTHYLVNEFTQIGGNILAGTTGGIVISKDGGTNWGPSNSGLPANTWVTGFAVLGTNVFLGSQGNGIYVSSNNGVSWSSANGGLTNKFVQTIVTDGTNLYAGTYGGLWGTSGGGVFVSSNGGSSWTESSNGITDSNVTALVVSGGNVFAGTSNGGVFVTLNGGQRWGAVNNGLNYEWGIQALTTDGSNIYASSEAYGLYKSADNGASWSAVNSPIDYISSVALKGTQIYVGSGSGVFLSTDGGKAWSSFNTGLTDSLVSTVAVIGNYIYAGNYAQTEPVIYRGPLLDFGIWRRSLK